MARQREHELDLARLRAQQEAAARERRDAEDRKAKERRRATVQRVKDRAIARYWSIDYTIPEETKAHALAEIETELARLPVDELPEAELVTIAAGIRDRIYKPVLQAQDRAKAEEARKQHQARQRADLIESGLAYARRELRREQDLDAWTRSDIERKVEEILEQEIDGRESEAEVRDLVDETLDETLDEADEKRWAKARPKLIAHGSAYARRELAHEKGLDGWERSRIERQVKQALEGEITGDESERDVEALVDDILDEELGEAEDDEGF